MAAFRGGLVRPAALASRALAAGCGLPRPLTDRVEVRRGFAVRMRDGVILRTDHYAPALSGAPTLLVRTPYGRGGLFRTMARALAEQGFHVVVQSCRGTFDSGGGFDPMRHEREDGLDTVDWLRRQPWYGGAFAMFGPSYVGFVQWAVAAEAGPDLRALATAVTASSFRDATYAGGSFSLDTVLTWSAILAAQRGSIGAALLEQVRGQPRLRRGLAHPVLTEADALVVGARLPYFQDWLREEAADAPYWAERRHDHRIAEVTAPTLMVGGWYDIFLPWQLADHAALRAAGRTPRLLIGPWHHGSLGLARESLREGVRFLRAQLYGEADLGPATPVRVHVGGADEWRDLPDWPPPHEPQAWYLRADGSLSGSGDEGGGPARRFRYDPADPTPAVGGPRLMGQVAGVRDNRSLEARPDVLTYTGAPLEHPLEIMGPVRAVIRMASSLPHFDVFVRVCDVAPDGRSRNVCDGLTRVPAAGDGVTAVEVELWPTAYRFAAGHRVRVQVSGGAHPRWARNPGTGAPLAEPGPLLASDREVHAGSAVWLPRT
jgi:uncharacterized protein